MAIAAILKEFEPTTLSTPTKSVQAGLNFQIFPTVMLPLTTPMLLVCLVLVARTEVVQKRVPVKTECPIAKAKIRRIPSQTGFVSLMLWLQLYTP